MADRSAPPTVSVVVPTRNRAHGLARVLDAVLADPSTAEVVVVDDRSTDGTAAVIDELRRRDARVRSVRGEGGGAAAARQLGLEAATGDIVLMLDDDVVAGRDLVSRHRDVHRRNGEVPVVVVGYMPTARPPVRRRGQFATFLYAAEYDAHVEGWEQGRSALLRSLWSGNVSAPRDTWLAVGVHDPAYPPVNHNDRDLGLRMEQQGVHAVFDRSLAAVHAHHRTMDQFLRDAHRQGAGRVLLHHRHGDRAPFDLDSLTEGLPAPARRLVLAADRRAVRRPVEAALRGTVRAAGAVHAWRVEDAAAKVLRRIALRAGALEALAGRVGDAPDRERGR